MASWVRRHLLVISFVLAYAISWIMVYAQQVPKPIAVTTQVSPSGNIIVEHREFKDLNETWYEIWLRSKENPSEQELLCKYYSYAEVLFSPDDSWIIVNNYWASDHSSVLLYKHKQGLKYVIEASDIAEKVWSFCLKKLGLSIEELGITSLDGIELTHAYAKGILWAGDSSAILLKLDGWDGDYSLNSWLCVYDLKTSRPTLELNVMNRNAMKK